MLLDELRVFIISLFYSVCFCLTVGRKISTVGLGTALQARRPQVPFPVVSWEFSFDVFLLATLWTCID